MTNDVSPTAGGSVDPSSTERQHVESTLAGLVVASWRDLDLNDGARLHEYFAEEAVYDFVGDTSRGRAALQERFARRLAAGHRTTMHLVTNFFCETTAPGTVLVCYYICVFGADGVAVQQVKLPTLIGTMEDIFTNAGGSWLIASRRFIPLFNDPIDRVGRRANGILR